MKQTWLYLALVASIQCLLPNILGWIWLLVGCAWLYKRQKKWVLISFCFCLLLQIRLSPQAQDPPASTQKVEILEVRSNYVIAKGESQTLLLYQLEDVGFHDILEIQATCEVLHSDQNFYLFDFKEWANRRGIQYGCSVEISKRMEQSQRMKAKLYRYILSMEEQPRNWLLQTFYGIQPEDSQLDVSFLLSSSGMHISYLAHLLQVLLTLWFPQVVAQCASLCFMMFLGNVTMLKDALQRILCFRFASFLFSKESPHDRLGIGMLFTLLLCPYMGQELSYVLPVMFRLIYLFNVQKRKQKLLSMMVLVPIQFHYFNEVDLVSLCFFGWFRKLYAILYLLACCYLMIPYAWLYEIAHSLLLICSWFNSFHLSFYYHASLGFVVLWFYVLFRYLSFHPKRSGYTLLSLLLFTQVEPYLRPYVEVVMINVGQGDSTLIILPFQQGNILIDVAGSKYKNIPKDVIVPQLHALGITSIDTLIITHDDLDHSGGLTQLQELMEVKQVITQKQEKLEFGDYKLHFLAWDKTFEDKNENSIITFFEAYDTQMIFMGDASMKSEAAILQTYPKLEADIIKVGHHGSSTSSDPHFIHQLHPSLALISCGYQNRYGHPSPETLETLQRENVLTLDTPTQGAVSIKLTFFLRFYKTASAEFGIIDNR